MASSRNNALEFSSVGSIVINAADGATTGTFGAIQFLKDSTLSALTATNVANSADLLTSFGAGTILYGNFTSVTVSGAASLVQLHIV
jgi:hypothetical protein|tara:strand:+ start:119 stop:379 length:261 start_codon:yes stop_codon:yes gene_type:complete